MIIHTSLLKDVLAHVGAAINKNASLPILSAVCIKPGDDDSLLFVGTTLDQAVQIKLESVEDILPTPVCVQHANFFNIVKNLTGAETSLLIKENNWLEVRSGQSLYKLPTFSSDEFPDIPAGGVSAFVVKGQDFASDMEKCRLLASDDEGRYVLCGVNVLLNDGNVQMEATDGRSATICPLTIQNGGVGEYSLLVPQIACRCIYGRFKDYAGNVVVRTDENKRMISLSARFDNYSYTLSSRLIDGKYPNIKNVFAQVKDEFAFTLDVDAESFAKDVSRALILREKNDDGNKVCISVCKERASIVVGTTEGHADIELDAEMKVVNECDILCNGKYLMAAMASHVDGESPMAISVIDEENPILIEGGEGRRVLIMPIRKS